MPPNQNFPSVTHAAASYPVSGILEKLGCSFRDRFGFLQRCWHLMTLASQLQDSVCSPKPACQNNSSLQQANHTLCHSPRVCAINSCLHPWSDTAECAGSPVPRVPELPWYQAEATTTPCLLSLCWPLRGAPCLTSTWVRAWCRVRPAQIVRGQLGGLGCLQEPQIHPGD